MWWQRALRRRLRQRERARPLFGDARGPEQFASSLSYFERGYLFGRRLPPGELPDRAASGEQPGPLEAYFDAHLEGPGIFKWRHYFPIYERHLSRFRGRSIGLLEIGVLGGGSVRMWREYLGAEVQVYGVDINPASRALAGEGIEIHIGDQADPAFWQEFLASGPTLDVVIDDGGHEARQLAVTMECLLAHVRPGGVYICEDIHGSFHPFHSFVDGLARPLSDVGPPNQHTPTQPAHEHVASVHHYPLLTVIEKPASCAPAFEAERRGSEWPEEKP